jgi:DNA-directed RNA polymerase specialized sigma24 family protein
MPLSEREAISLIEVWGFDPSQAAEICDCDFETIDRRVGMARCHLTARSPHPISVGAIMADTAAVHASAA